MSAKYNVTAIVLQPQGKYKFPKSKGHNEFSWKIGTTPLAYERPVQYFNNSWEEAVPESSHA